MLSDYFLTVNIRILITILAISVWPQLSLYDILINANLEEK